MKTWSRWSEQEDEVLRQLAPTMPYSMVADRLGRTELAVIGRARTLGVKGRPRAGRVREGSWTSDEDAVFHEFASTLSSKELADLLPGRTEGAVRRRRQYLGVSGRERGGFAPENDHLRLLPLDDPQRREVVRKRARESKRLWHLEHPEKRAEYESRRRIRKRNNGQEPYVTLAVFERDAWVCQLCFEPTDREAGWNHPEQPTVDHIVPLSLQGPDTFENVQTAHRRCNSIKQNRILVEA